MSLCNVFLIIISIILVFLLSLSVAIVVWLDKLKHSKECACSHDWKQEYILQFLSILIIWNIAFGSLVIYDMYMSGCNAKTLSYGLSGYVLRILFGVGMFAYIFIAYSYVKFLKEKECSCAMQSKGYTVLKLHASIKVAFLILSILSPLFVAIAVMFYFMLKKK